MTDAEMFFAAVASIIFCNIFLVSSKLGALSWTALQSQLHESGSSLIVCTGTVVHFSLASPNSEVVLLQQNHGRLAA
jgi:hypothetical protein